MPAVGQVATAVRERTVVSRSESAGPNSERQQRVPPPRTLTERDGHSHRLVQDARQRSVPLVQRMDFRIMRRNRGR